MGNIGGTGSGAGGTGGNHGFGKQTTGGLIWFWIWSETFASIAV